MLAKKVMGAGGVGGAVPAVPIDTVFSTSFSSGYFTSINVTNPYGLAQADYLSSLGAMRQFDVDRTGEIAYVGSGNGVLRSIDVSDPTNMSVLQSLSLGDMKSALAYDSVRNVVFANDWTNNRIYALDVSNPSNISTISTLSVTYDYIYFAYDEVNQILLGTLQAGLIDRFDVSNTSSMSLTGSFFQSGTNFLDGALDTANQVAFYADTDNRIRSVDYSSSTVSLIGQSVSSGAWYNCVLDVGNSVVYAVGGPYNLASFDVSNPSSMTVLDTYSGSTVIDLPFGVVLDAFNEVLYVNGYSGNEISAFDVSDPTNLTLLANATSTQMSDTIYLQGI